MEQILTPEFILSRLKSDLEGVEKKGRQERARISYHNLQNALQLQEAEMTRVRSFAADQGRRSHAHDTVMVEAMRTLEPLSIYLLREKGEEHAPTPPMGSQKEDYELHIDLLCKVACLTDLPTEVRWRAALKLQECEPYDLDEDQIKMLTESIDDENWMVRKHIINCVGKHVTNNTKPKERPPARWKNEDFCAQARAACEKICARMCQQLEDSAQVREAAVSNARHFCFDDLIAHAAMIAEGCLKDNDPDVRDRLAKLLHQIDDHFAQKDAEPADKGKSGGGGGGGKKTAHAKLNRQSEDKLKDMLLCKDKTARVLAMNTLAVIDVQDDEIRDIEEGVAKDDEDPEMRAMAARALGGHDDEKIVDEVNDMLRDYSPQVRVKGVEMVTSMGDSHDIFVPQLALMLTTDDNEPVCAAIAAAFGSLGNAGDLFVEAVATALFHGAASVRAAAFNALREMGNQAKLKLVGAICQYPPKSLERFRMMHAFSIMDMPRADVACAFLCEWVETTDRPCPIYHLKVIAEGGRQTCFAYKILTGKGGNAYIVFENRNSAGGASWFSSTNEPAAFDWTALLVGGVLSSEYLKEHSVEVNQALWSELSKSIMVLKKQLTELQSKRAIRRNCVAFICGFGQGGIAATALAIMLTNGSVAAASGLTEAFKPGFEEMNVVTFSTPQFLIMPTDPDKAYKVRTMMSSLQRGKSASLMHCWRFAEDPVPAFLSERSRELSDYASRESGMLFRSEIQRAILAHLSGENDFDAYKKFISPIPQGTLPLHFASSKWDLLADLHRYKVDEKGNGPLPIFSTEVSKTFHYTDALLRQDSLHRMVAVISVFEKLFSSGGEYLVKNCFHAWSNFVIDKQNDDILDDYENSSARSGSSMSVAEGGVQTL